jgi:hypothetical protein
MTTLDEAYRAGFAEAIRLAAAHVREHGWKTPSEELADQIEALTPPGVSQ